MWNKFFCEKAAVIYFSSSAIRPKIKRHSCEEEKSSNKICCKGIKSSRLVKAKKKLFFFLGSNFESAIFVLSKSVQENFFVLSPLGAWILIYLPLIFGLSPSLSSRFFLIFSSSYFNGIRIKKAVRIAMVRRMKMRRNPFVRRISKYKNGEKLKKRMQINCENLIAIDEKYCALWMFLFNETYISFTSRSLSLYIEQCKCFISILQLLFVGIISLFCRYRHFSIMLFALMGCSGDSKRFFLLSRFGIWNSTQLEFVWQLLEGNGWNWIDFFTVICVQSGTELTSQFASWLFYLNFYRFEELFCGKTVKFPMKTFLPQ